MRNDLDNLLQGIAQQLKDAPKIKPFTDKHWRSAIDVAPGVYVIWHAENGKPAYIGETSLLKERCRDLGSWRNHTFTRQIREELERHRKLHTPEAIRTYINEQFRITCLPLDIGRKEVEEYLIDEWETEQPKGFNKVAKRYRRSKVR